jgi:nucleoside-diphosphate-sugar epimerase
MNVLLAGATGALGIPLTRQLLARGHQVLGLTRGPAGAARLKALGAWPVVTQSFVLGYGYRDHGGRVLTERDPFGEAAGDRNDPHLAAMRSTEQQALSAPEGIALRYGLLYGADADRLRPVLATRRLPVADGGVLGWVHHEDAAAATVAALERGRAGQAYNVVADRPASWREVFTAMATAVIPHLRRGDPGHGLSTTGKETR